MKEVPIENFLGLNLRDSADKVKDNEFTVLQNVYQPTKGILARRFGSVSDQATGFDLVSRISGVWRHYAPNGDRVSIYHCIPDSTLLPDNTSDLTLADLNDSLGNIFAGGGVVTVRVCYSWIGRGMEQTYNTRNRASFPGSGSFPLNAWSNPAHQSITLGGTTHSLQVTCPAFPTGITGANVFYAIGTSTQMAYAGTITTSAGSLIIRENVATNGARDDAITGGSSYQATYSASGTLKPGNYRVAMAWLIDNNRQEGSTTIFGGPSRMEVKGGGWVTVAEGQNAILITAPTANSANGANALYVFVGTNLETLIPLTCVGMVRVNGTLKVNSIPSTNAQTAPFFQAPEATGAHGDSAIFTNSVNSQWIGSVFANTQSKVQARGGFLLAKSAGGSIREIFPSRSHWDNVQTAVLTQIFSGDSWTSVPPGQLGYVDLHNFWPNPRTQNDRFQSSQAGGGWTQPYTYARPPIDPNFCYQLGISYFANGADIPWMTDGYVLGQLAPAGAATQTLLPPPPRFITIFQSSLVAFGALNDNLLYMSNANAPQNWATGGTGTALRFVPIGDATGSGGTALGIFTPASEAPASPSSLLIGFKKNGTWMIASVPDPTANALAAALSPQLGVAAYTGTPMQQISGRTGCVAYRTVIQTPIGTLFLGQDGNVYRISAIRDPLRIGWKIQNGLSHLVGNDAAMKLCTAVYHDNHYKLSYPSAAALLANPIINDSEFWADLRVDEESPITWVGPHQGRNIGPQVVLVGDSDDLSRLVADQGTVRTYTADSISTYADLAANGSAQAITAKIKSKIFRMGSSAHIKRFFGALLDMYIDESFSNNVLFEGWADVYYQQINRQLSNAGGVWDSSKFDQTFFADATWLPFSFLFNSTNLLGSNIQWQISTSDQAPFILAKTIMYVKPEKRRLIA